MSDNDTSVYDVDSDGVILKLLSKVEDIVEISLLVLSLVALVYGLISWCVFNKFRKYRNYIFLNAIFTNFLQYIVITIVIPYSMTKNQNDLVTRFINVYLMSVKNHWLLVICHLFYTDFVKVFDAHIQRRYLKSALFAWGVSFITTIIFVFMFYFLFYSSNYMVLVSGSVNYIRLLARGSSILALIANCCLYVIIVYSVCRSFNMSGNTTTNVWRRLYIATLIFILSDVIMLSEYVMSIFNKIYSTTAMDILEIILMNFNGCVLPMFLIFAKSNRLLWYEFYVHKLKQKLHRNHDIDMQGKNICIPTECRPAEFDV